MCQKEDVERKRNAAVLYVQSLRLKGEDAVFDNLTFERVR